MTDISPPQVALELGDEFEIALILLVRRHRGEEITRVGQAVGADRPQVRQFERLAVVLTHVAARRAIGQLHAKAHAARDHRDLLRRQFQHAQFGGNPQPALLRHHQQLAIGTVEKPALHIRIGRVHVDADARAGGRAAIAGHGEQPVDEIDCCSRLRQGQRIPAQLVRRHRAAAEVFMQPRLVERGEFTVHRRRPDPVQPAAPVGMARRGERGTGQLFRVKTVRHLLRGVAAHRQRTGHRLGGELVSKAGHVARDMRGDGHGLFLWQRLAINLNAPPIGGLDSHWGRDQCNRMTICGPSWHRW